MRAVKFIGGPIDGQLLAIEDDDQMTYSCFVNMGEWVSEHRYKQSYNDSHIFVHESGDYRFIVETDQPDEEGTVINLDGIEAKDRTLININFDLSPKMTLGKANTYVLNNALWCQCRLKIEHLDLYPAIGFEVIKWEQRPEGKYYEQIRLQQIGLCDKPNLNPNIKTIRQQIQDNETP